MVKTTLTFVCCLFGLLASQAQNVKLEVKVDGFENNTGKLKVGLYNSEGTFLKTVYKSLTSDIANKTATVVFTDIPKGEYAITLYHDENANGTLDRNVMGIPTEDYASSNDAKAIMGPPKYADAKFTLATNSKITIILNN